MNGACDEIFANCKQVSEVSFPSLRWFGLLQMFPQCRRILGGRKLLIYVRTVVTAIFVMTKED